MPAETEPGTDDAGNPEHGSPERQPPSPQAKRALSRLRKVALGYPETVEEFPWGERVVKVRGKVFVFFGASGPGFGMTVKLPNSQALALAQPHTVASAYGLGRAGWVTIQYPPDEDPELDMLLDWIDESFRAVAPKKLIAQLPSYSGGVSNRASMKLR